MITVFAGETHHPLDDKNRLSIPAKYRRWATDGDSGCTFVVTKGSDPCLVCYPATEWDGLSEKLLKLSYFKKKNRAFIRALARSSVRLRCDGQGRILIPPTLLEYANIKKEVTIIGALNRLELWDPQTLDQHAESSIPLDDEYFEDLGDIL